MCGARRSVFDELDSHGLWYETGGHAAGEKLANCVPAAVTVIERPIVHIHADESVGFCAVQASGELHRVVQRLNAMLQSIRYTVAKMSRNHLHERQAKVLPDDVAAEREGETGLLEPPLAHVGHEVQSA